MPLDEEGAKWSCEPCVRGHRSSKCEHYDRLMMKVPKAGRPLAKCPHPKGSCSCQRIYAVMVRIPRGSSCVCRPLYQVPANSAEATSIPTSSGTSSVATSSSPAPGRVQKHPRRQSNLQAAPESIAKAVGSKLQQTDPNSGVGTPNMKPTDSPLQKSLDAKDAPAPSGGGSCCSQNPQHVTSPVPQGSCCSGAQSATDEKVQMPIEENPASVSWNETSYAASQMPSWDQQPQNDQYFPHGSTLAHFPPQGSNYSDHMLPPSSMLADANRSSASGFNIPSFSDASMDQLFANGHPGHPLIPSTYGGDSSHECSCGEGCQCLGCASHPFNSTTRQHVQEMGYMMSINEDDENSDSANPFMKPMSPPLYATHTLPNTRPPYQATQSFIDNTAATSNFDSVVSPDASFTAEGLMQPSEYYTLTYPVGLPDLCSNVTGTCQCGSDCTCIGCLTHSGHNGVALEPAPAENGQAYHEPISYVPQQRFDYAVTPRSLDEFSPSARSPSLIETPSV